jgi:hypothetical protein
LVRTSRDKPLADDIACACASGGAMVSISVSEIKICL